MFWVLVFHLLTTDICSCSCISHNKGCWQFASGSHILIVLLSNHLLSDTHCSIGRSLAFDFVWNWWFSWNFNGSGSVIISHSRRSKFWKLLSICRSLNSTEISSNRSNLYKSCLVCARTHTHTSPMAPVAVAGDGVASGGHPEWDSQGRHGCLDHRLAGPNAHGIADLQLKIAEVWSMKDN